MGLIVLDDEDTENSEDIIPPITTKTAVTKPITAKNAVIKPTTANTDISTIEHHSEISTDTVPANPAATKTIPLNSVVPAKTAVIKSTAAMALSHALSFSLSQPPVFFSKYMFYETYIF